MSAESPRHARSGGPLTVPSQPPSDRSLIDAVSGFISDVTLSSTSNVDPKDVIQWARFETADINEPTPEGDSDNDISPLLLILGYGSGVQVWLIPPTGEAQEVLSWRQGTVRVLRILPTPQRGDCFASKRPLIALCDSASPGPTFCSLSFISIKGGEQVKSIKFKNPILDVLANKRSVVVSFSERFAVFDAATLEDRIAITTCYPCPCPLGGNQPINPLALGDRWLAYADKKLNPSKRSSGGCESESVTSYTATVLHAAKSLSKGLRGLGESMAHSLAGARGTSQSPSPPNTDIQQSGVVTVLDIEGNEVDDGPELEEPYDPLVAHFVAHSEAIIAMKFDSSGMLLVTADRRGHDFHVFRLNPHPCGPSLASVHHLYVLHRGDTTAKVQDIAISGDSRWAAISTLRGTTHLFAISPYGGACGVRTHTSPRVVNRLSRFHRSAGLPIHARHSPVNDIVGAGSAWYPNPRLPPYPQPVQAAPLAQLRPTDLPTRTITRTSSGRQRLSSLSEDSNAAPLLARATFGLCAGGTGAGAGGQQRAPVAALYLLAAGGGLSHLALRPRPAANVPKDKICDETPLELQVEPIAQWPLQRGSAADILAPLPPSNPLLQPLSCRRCADMCMNEEERWLSQVEIVTHAGPHRRLWMGPQFVFKTYNCTGSTSSLSEAETVEVDTTSSSVARSNPVNMPSVLPVLIDSGSNSSLEHSPSEHFRRKSLLAETGRAASVCDVQLKEDLAEAMKEEQGWRSESSSAGAGGGGGVARAVDPLGTVVAPPATRAPPALDPDDYTTSNADEATFRPVVRAPAAIPREPDIIVRPLPRNTTIPVQNVSPVGTLSPEDEPLPLNTDVVIPAALTNVPQWKMEPESTEIIAKREVAVEERKNKASPPREEAAVEERKAKVSPPREETIREERKAKVYPPRQQATVEECKAGLSSPREKVTIEKPKEKVSPSREEAIVEERNAGLSHSREKLTIEEPKANVSPPKEEAAAEERKSKASPPKEEATKKIEKKKAIPLDAEKSTKLDKISKQMSEQRKTEIKPDQSTKTKESKVGKSTQQDYNKADKSRGQRDMAAIREKSLRQRDFVAIPDDITKQKKEKEEKSIEDKRSKQTVIENELQENYDEPENPDVETAKKKDRIILDVKKTDVNKDLSRQVIDARKCDIERDRGSAECAERESNDSKSLPKSNRASDDIQPTARTRIKKSPTPKLVSDRDSEDSVKDNKTNNLNDSKLNEPKEVKDNKDIKKQNNNKELKALKEFKVTKDDRSKLSSDENSSIEILEDVKNSDKNLVSISDEPSIAVTLKLPYKPNQAHDTQAKKREDIEIKTEEQAWDMLNEPEKPILNISDQSIDEKPKLKRNRKSKKSQDELQSKADEDSFVEIHAIEENQSCSGDLVSISTPFEELESDSSYLSKTKKPRSPKCLTPEKCDDYERKPTSSFLVEEPFSYSSKLKKKLGDVSSNLVPITEPKAQAYKELVKEPQSPNTLKIKKHIDGTASESSSLIFKDVKPQKSKSLSPYPEGCKIEKPSEQKEIYVINTTEDDFPEIQITRGTKIQRKSPQPENNIFVKETALEKPVKSWSSIAASKNIKKTENILEKKVNDDLKDAAEAIEENLEFAVSFQDKLFELCKRTDIMVAECDTPSDLDFVEEHHNVLHDLPPLEPLDFGLKDFNLEVMRDSLLDVHDPKITSPICKINIDDILFSIKDTTSKVIESSSFNLIDLEKVPAKKEKGFSVIESTKIKSQDIKLHYDTKVEEGEVMEKSSDEDNTSPIVSTDSDKEDKKNGVASNLVLPSGKQSAKSKKSRRKKK